MWAWWWEWIKESCESDINCKITAGTESQTDNLYNYNECTNVTQEAIKDLKDWILWNDVDELKCNSEGWVIFLLNEYDSKGFHSEYTIKSWDTIENSFRKIFNALNEEGQFLNISIPKWGFHNMNKIITPISIYLKKELKKAIIQPWDKVGIKYTKWEYVFYVDQVSTWDYEEYSIR